MLESKLTRRQGNFIGFVTCAALMAYALYAQYVVGLEPCPLCIFQRVAVIVLGVWFLLAALQNPERTGARIYLGLQLLTVIGGVLIASRHIWIQAQPPGTVAACGADLNYMLKILPVTEVITKVLTGSGECAQINWRFLGLSMPWWVLIALACLGAWALVINTMAPKQLSKTA